MACVASDDTLYDPTRDISLESRSDVISISFAILDNVVDIQITDSSSLLNKR